MNRFKRLIVLFTLIFTITLSHLPVFAASFGISASKTSVSPNETFTVNVGGDCIGRVNLTVSNGSLSTSEVWVEMGTVSVTVTAGSSGTVTVTATPTAGFSDADGDEYNPGSKSVSVSIKTPQSEGSGGSSEEEEYPYIPPTIPFSSDNNLKSLSVSKGTLTPSFSSSITSYTVNLDATVTSIDVSASVNDISAKLSGTGTKELEPGENTIKITVTAENGNPKVYTIKAIVDEKPLVFLSYGDKQLGVVRNLRDLKTPSGFEETAVKVNGQDTSAWFSSKRNITLLYLQDENDKDFYVYDGNKIVSMYQSLKGIGNNLAFVGVPTDLQVRNGMTFTDVKIGKNTLKGWVYNDENMADYSLIYVMNEHGEYKYYQYENTEKTLQLYPNATFIAQEEFDSLVKENELVKEEKENMTIYFYIACIVAVIGTAFGIYGFINANRYKKRLLTRNRFSEDQN